jgi:hypothetical protein
MFSSSDDLRACNYTNEEKKKLVPSPVSVINEAN